MQAPVKNPILLSPASAKGCEIIVPITIKMPIFLKIEGVGMPSLCYQQELSIEPKQTLCATPATTQGDLEIDIFPVDVEVMATPSESDVVIDAVQSWMQASDLSCEEKEKSSLSQASEFIHEVNPKSNLQNPKSKDKEQAQPDFWAKMQHNLAILAERKKQIMEHIERTLHLSHSLFTTQTNSEARKQQIIEHLHKSRS